MQARDAFAEARKAREGGASRLGNETSAIVDAGADAQIFAPGVEAKDLIAFDASDLEQRFRTLSRQFHPDYFYNATPAERRAQARKMRHILAEPAGSTLPAEPGVAGDARSLPGNAQLSRAARA